MREKASGHEVVCLNRGDDISTMYAASNTHQHVLGPLDNLAMDAQKIRFFQSLEAEVIVFTISGIVDSTIELRFVRIDEIPDSVCYE
jgi:hypothetical protein